MRDTAGRTEATGSRSMPGRTISPEDEAALLETIDRWVERDVRPVVKDHDHADEWPARLVEQMAALGPFGVRIGTDHGGLGLPAATYAKLVMRISAAWRALTGIFNSHLMLALALERFGTERQKARWLPDLAAGRLRGGLALTEPDAGTGLSVGDVSYRATANLGWTDIRLAAPVFVGDTLYAESEVVALRESATRPTQGIVTVRTRGLKADGTEVIRFERTILVPKRGHAVDEPEAKPGA